MYSCGHKDNQIALGFISWCEGFGGVSARQTDGTLTMNCHIAAPRAGSTGLFCAEGVIPEVIFAISSASTRAVIHYKSK